MANPLMEKREFILLLRFILAALNEGINLFVLEDAVLVAKKGQETKEMPALLESWMPNCEELLKVAFKQGGFSEGLRCLLS